MTKTNVEARLDRAWRALLHIANQPCDGLDAKNMQRRARAALDDIAAMEKNEETAQ